MELRAVRIYRGPNQYGFRPVMRWTLELGMLENYPTDRLGDFGDRLLALMPTLEEHGCSYRTAGGFVRRLRDGTWLGHVAEHLALEIQNLAGIPVTYGKTRSTGGGPGEYYVVYSYREERVGLAAGWLALRLIQALLPDELRGITGLGRLSEPGRLAPASDPFDYHTELAALVELATDVALGPTTQSLVDEAQRRGIPTMRLDEQSLVQLGHGVHQHRIRAAVTGRTSYLGVETASDKALTNQLLRDAGIPVPANVMVHRADDAVTAARKIGYPVVTKPLDVSHGRGVSIDLRDETHVRWGFDVAAKHSSTVLVEQFLVGNDHRVLVVNDQVVAVAERTPAHVVGDGQHSVEQLVELTNRDPRRGVGHEKVLTRITINEQAERLMQAAGYGASSVLPAGEVLFLRATANLSTGGTAVDRTDDIHPTNVLIARRAARAIGLDICGIDMITSDIRRPLDEVDGGIVEVNAGPGFRMHLEPSSGTPRNVAAPVIEMLFPAGQSGRIPLIGITGTNGKTTTARMVAHVLKIHGKRVGLTTTDGIYVDGEHYLSGDLTGPWSARVVLKDPKVEVAVLETARGGMLREGLGFERLDVGAVLNVREDHLGLEGIDTLEQLAEIKVLVVEVVRPEGFAVLNADDPHCVAMASKAGGAVVYFSSQVERKRGTALEQHIDGGGIAVMLQGDTERPTIVIHDRGRVIELLRPDEIPATLGGFARANVQNALAATAMLYVQGVPIDVICQGLRSFSTRFEDTPGRLNVYEGHPFRVIMDYGHNAAALEQMSDLVQRLHPQHRRVVGVVAGPGDRRDEDLRALGRIAAGFLDEMVVREDASLRGRARGDVARLICAGAQEAQMADKQITVVISENEAVLHALTLAGEGDLLVLLADEPTAVWQAILAFRAVT
ncbi:MAG: cyanophycin synthetase [Herpetosiphon sp.]